MRVDFLSQAGNLLKEQKQYRRRLIVFLCLAVIVMFGTVTALKLYGQAMTHKMEVLDCQYEVHQHTESCYSQNEDGGQDLVCGYADYVVHLHNDSCYDGNGNLVCTLEEHAIHEHTEDCYVTELVLICEEEETGATVEGGEGASDDAEPSDAEEPSDTEEPADTEEPSDAEESADSEEPSDAEESADTEESSDAEESADAEGSSDAEETSGTEESSDAEEPADAEESSNAEQPADTEEPSDAEEPADAEESSDAEEPADTGAPSDAEEADGTEAHAESSAAPQQEVLTCGKEVHKHDESCYGNELACGYEEHTHGEGCTSRELDCVAAEHTHGDGCYDEEGSVTCGMEEHAHTDGCYRNIDACGKEEHRHSEGCYQQVLTCGMEEHTHDGGCYAAGGIEELAENVEPAESAEPDESAGAEAEPEEGGAEDAAPEEAESAAAGHVHTEECYAEVKVLVCGELELHTHDNSCYSSDCFDEEGNLMEGSRVSCGLLQLEEHMHEGGCIKVIELTPEEVEALNQGAELHIHEDSCYDEEENLICGHEATHIHVLECYDETGKAVCGYGAASHVHEKRCYDEEGSLTCGYETASHVHEESCYDKEGNLHCGYETAKHVHEDGCYDEDKNLICGYETAAHVHALDCYDEEGNLICGHEAASHAHKAECYDEEGNLVCGYETAAHKHEAGCYDEEGSLICGYDALAHLHEEGCYDREGNLICGYETAAHMHERECYDGEGNLICGYDTIAHEHGDNCYDEEGRLVCGFDEEGNLILPLYCAETIHTHTRACYDRNEELDCGKADYAVHTHGNGCFGADGNVICPLPEVEGQLHAHTESCYDENGSLVCGQLEVSEHIHSAACMESHAMITKSYQGDGFIVTATYMPEALPRDAELIAERITEESDEEHYAERQAQYQEAVGDSKATMRALLKVGFYVNGEEVEPEENSIVTVTIQFLDENGLVEGKPIEIVHFADDGTENLKGSNVEDGSTTFETGSFSEYGVGHGAENVTVPVDEVIEYETDDFHITFKIKGDASVPIDAIDDENKESNEAEAVEPENGEEGEGGSTEGDVFTAPVKTDILENDLEFQLEEKGEDSEEYAAVVAYGEETGDEEGEELLLKVWNYSVNFNGTEVDLSNCEVTAEFTPSRKLVKSLKEATAVPEEQPGAVDTPEGDGASGSGEGQLAGELQQAEAVAFSFMNFSRGAKATAELEAIQMAEVVDKIESTKMALPAQTFAVKASGQLNPNFTVQYYANLNVVTTTTEKGTGNVLTLIDTSGKKLPTNKGDTTTAPTDNFKFMYVDDTGMVQTVNELTEVYTSRSFEYYKAPTINYMDSLIENINYELKEVWVLKDGKEADSTNKDDWDVYGENGHIKHTKKCYTEKKEVIDSEETTKRVLTCKQGVIHFTNRKESATSGYILIEDNAVIRFVYDTTSTDKDFSASFYDYDITNGRVHRAKPPENPNQYAYKTAGQTFSGNSLTSEVLAWANDLKDGDGHLYAFTKEQGINSSGNYSGSGTKLAFGNVNTGTGLGKLTWSKDRQANELNKYNNRGYQGCTFGLVTGMSDGKIQYASGIQAPNLFNEGDAAGKTIYESDYSLQFKRVGDTYTLSAVNDTGATGLEGFSNPKNSTGTHTDIWTNNFWPMDSASSFGTGTHDVKFGGTATFKGGEHEIRFGPITQKGTDYTFPESDDGLYHNSYFGMHYEVEFDLSKDYVGPLEYYFFGDDDMWVFLDGELVCDIGGVHSSVGEYVNLWDYLAKGSEGKHTLNFFYTERGASGSTCWMQFTLPSVSSITPETTDKDYGELRVEKTVTQINNGVETIVDNDDEFKFEIHFTDEYNNNLPDDYSYVKYAHNENCYDDDGELICDYSNKRDREIDSNLIIWDGGQFTLKNGEYIIVKFLPKGTQYKVTEQNVALTVTNEASKVEYFTDIGVAPLKDENGNLVDGVLLVELHTHSTECYKEGELICTPMTTLVQKEKVKDYLHVHDKATCFSNGKLTCQLIEYVEAKNLSGDNKIAGGVIYEDSQNIVKYNNKFYVYGLPETGGSGTILYTMAGGIVVLLGAGLLYRKKFRERRA